MVKKIINTIIIGCLISIFFACAPTNVTINQLVPDNTLLYAQISSPEEMLANVDGFVKTLGISELTKGATATDSIKEALTTLGLSIDMLDMKQPLGVAALAPAEGAAPGMNSLLLLIPMKEVKSFDELKKALGDKEFKGIKKVGSYAVLSLKAEDIKSYPPKKTLDLTRLSSATKGSISVYADVKKILAASGIGDLATVKSMVLPLLSQSGADLPASSKEMLQGMVNKVFEVAEQLEIVSFNLLLNDQGIAFTDNYQFTEKGTVADFGKKAAPKPGIKAYGKYIPTSALLGCVINMDPAAYSEISTSLFDLIFKAVNVNVNETGDLKNALADMYKGIGSLMSTSLTINFDYTKLMTAIGTSNLAAIPQGFNFTAYSVMEVKDKKILQDAYSKALTSPVLSKILTNSLKETGVKLSLTVAKDKDDKGFKYDEVGYKIDIDTKVKATPELQMVQGLMSFMLGNMKIFMSYKDSKCYMTIGGDGLKTLKSFIENDGFKNKAEAIDQSESLKTLWAGIPDDASMIYSFSLPAVINMAAGIPEVPVKKISQADVPGFVGYAKINNNQMSDTFYWPMSGMKPIIDSNKAAIMGLIK